ncbi:MAG: MATE family efflux transporter, partial [Acetanaerobacterium sp.]
IAAIALPVALQNLIGFGVNMTDTLMLGALGEAQLSAVSLANQPFFVFGILAFGIASGVSVLTAQYWGRGDILPIRRVFAIAIDISTLVSLLFFVAAFFFSREIMGIFSTEEQIIELGAQYLKIISFSYIFFGISSTYLSSIRSVEQVKIPLLVYGTSFLINAAINYVLIFGKFGFPALGVRGAAIGTLTARVVEFVIVFVYMRFYEKKIRLRFRDLLRIDKIMFGDYLRHGMPVMFNELVWSVGMAIQSVIIGRIGSDFVAANSIVGVFQQLTTIVIFGMANAAAVVVGKAVGKGDNEHVRRCADTLLLLSLGVGILGAAIMLSLRGVAIGFYNVPDSTKQIANSIMIIASINVVFVSLNSINLMGTLRGAGDTRFAFVADTILIWVLSAPLGILSGWVLGLPAWAVFICLRMDEPLKAIAIIARIKGTKWINNVTR